MRSLLLLLPLALLIALHPAPVACDDAADLAFAWQFLDGLSAGINVERHQMWGKGQDYWNYVRSKGVTHVRTFYPFRPSINMDGPGDVCSIPDTGRYSRSLDQIELAVAAGMKVFFDILDIVGIEDLATTGCGLDGRKALYDVMDMALDLIAARNWDPTKVAIGPVNEWEGDEAATYNPMRQDFHLKIRAKLPEFVVVHGSEDWKHYSRMMGAAFWRPMDRRVIYDFHAYENDWTNWEWLRSEITKWQADNGNLPVFWGEAGTGSGDVADNQASMSAWPALLQSKFGPMCWTRPALWAVANNPNSFGLNHPGDNRFYQGNEFPGAVDIESLLQQLSDHCAADIAANPGPVPNAPAPSPPPAGPAPGPAPAGPAPSPPPASPAPGPAPSPSGSYIGCYIDNAERVMSGATYEDFAGMTPDACRAFCKDFAFAGVQWHGQCFCGNQYAALGRAPESECNAACAGDANTMCGGGWRLSVYSTASEPVAPVDPYVGCFVDSADRLLTGPLKEDWSGMTVDLCRTFCKDYTYAGLEYHAQCFCGDAVATSSQTAEGECDTPCAGDSSAVCGGGWRLSVYHSNAGVYGTTVVTSLSPGGSGGKRDLPVDASADPAPNFNPTAYAAALSQATGEPADRFVVRQPTLRADGQLEVRVLILADPGFPTETGTVANHLVSSPDSVKGYTVTSATVAEHGGDHLSKGAIAGIAVACVAAVVAVVLVIVFLVARMRARAAVEGTTPYRAFDESSTPVFK